MTQEPSVPGSARVDRGEPALGDAFGQLLARCWAGAGLRGVAWEMVERDDGFLDGGDAARYFAIRDLWPEPERWACDHVYGRVLDVGCGAGRHAVDLLGYGVEVVGLEPSPGAAAIARERGVTVIEAGIDDLRPDAGPFDTIIMLGSNLGLLGSAERAPGVLARLAAVATPGGLLVATGADPYATDTPEHLAYHARNRARGRLGGQITMRVRHRHVATDWFEYLFASRDELADLVTGSPWRLEAFHPDAAGGPGYAVVLRRA